MKFGALRFGMSTKEARGHARRRMEGAAGAPSPGIAYEIKASQLLELGGLRHDVQGGFTLRRHTSLGDQHRSRCGQQSPTARPAPQRWSPN